MTGIPFDPLMTPEGYARLQQRMADLRRRLMAGDFTWTPQEIGALCADLLMLETLASAYQGTPDAPEPLPGGETLLGYRVSFDQLEQVVYAKLDKKPPEWSHLYNVPR